MASVRVENAGQPQQPAIKIEEKKQLSRAKAIQICEEKYPKDFKRKKILTLVIAIGALALFIIPTVAMGLAALSLCTFPIGLLITTPVALVAISILIKKIDDRTLYWSGNLARIIIEKKEKEAREAAEKAAKANQVQVTTK